MNKTDVIIKIGKNNASHFPIIHFQIETPLLFTNLNVPISRSFVKLLYPSKIISKGMIKSNTKSGVKSPNLANPV